MSATIIRTFEVGDCTYKRLVFATNVDVKRSEGGLFVTFFNEGREVGVFSLGTGGFVFDLTADACAGVVK